ncbi:MAG: MMPL family transporter [Treponema sp.]|jgi:predicted RND superfamily exporter protein|nr:MMPL family transporter [Treponema sp.]
MERLYGRPFVIVAIVAAITAFFAAQLPRAELDNNNTRFIPKENESRVISDYIEETFGASVMILVGLERPYGTVFEPAFLERIREYSQTIETVEFVKSVNSIMSTQYITGDADSIIVTDLTPKGFAGTQAEITELKRRIASWDLYRGTLVSDNLSATQIIVSLDVKTEDVGLPEVVETLVAIRETAKEMFAGFAEVYVTGLPVISATINESMGTDLAVLIPLSALVVLTILFFSFRRFTFVALPLLTVIVAVIWTVGAMPLFGIKLSILSTVLPVILIAVGSAYGIHVVTHYMEDTQNRPSSVEEHRALVYELMRKLIKPVFLAALTTFAGFGSFCFTSIIPIREFGYFSSFGVAASFIVAVTLIPALLLIRGPRILKDAPKRRAKRAGRADSSVNSAIGNVFVSIAKRRALVLSAVIVALAVSGYGLSKLVVDNSTIEFFRNDTDIGRSDWFIREYFGGSRDLALLVEAESSEAALDPAVLSAIDGLSTYLMERVPEVGKVMGFTDVIKRVNQVFNVDESPDGLRPVSGAGSAADGFGFGDESDFGLGGEDGFGFGDESGFGFGGEDGFGFGDESGFGFGGEDSFGFDDESGFGFGGEDGFGFDAPAEEPAEAAMDAGTSAARMEQYSAADIIAILDAASGKSLAMSGNDLIREVQRLTNYNGFAYYEIPSSPERYGKTTTEELRQLISNYLVLLSGDDSFDYSNDPLEPTAIKMTIQLRTTTNSDTKRTINTIKSYIDANFPKTVRVLISGGAVMEGAVADLIVGSQITSLVISVLMVFIIVALSNRSISAGLIGAVPLAIAILANFAVMGFLGIKLNIGTALIASLAVGIGIDYTIHCIEFFKREYQADHSSGNDFLRRTFTGCGKAILINAVSVGAGFAVLSLSQFKILSELGALVALSMAITAVVSLTVIPVLLTTVKPKFIYGANVSASR